MNIVFYKSEAGMSFKIGDVVQLKSGGSKMTVLETNDAGMVMCTWLDSNGLAQEKAFNHELLRIYKKPSALPMFGGE